MDLLKKGMLFVFAATLFVACSDDDDDVVVTPEEPVVVNNHPLADTSWKFKSAAGAAGVGPGKGDGSWWSNSEADALTDRACLFDDTYTFNADYSFVNSQGSDTWLDKRIAGQATALAGTANENEGCGAPVAPHNGSNAATWTADSTTFTIVGEGAYFGLAVPHNTAEDGDPVDDTIVYEFEIVGDELIVGLTGFNGGAYWNYTMVKAD